MTDHGPTGPLDELVEAGGATSRRQDDLETPSTTHHVESTDDSESVVRQRDAYHDQLARVSADFDNYRKRVERERRDLIETAAANLLRDLLPLVDDLERALQSEAGSEGAEAYRQGVALIHRQLLDLLQKNGVTPIEALGTTFDPHLHQAVTHEVSSAHADGEVIAELRRGYRLGSRLLRPAMVKVAKA